MKKTSVWLFKRIATGIVADIPSGIQKKIECYTWGITKGVAEQFSMGYYL